MLEPRAGASYASVDDLPAACDGTHFAASEHAREQSMTSSSSAGADFRVGDAVERELDENVWIEAVVESIKILRRTPTLTTHSLH
jgi:hypothetical protein